MKKITLIILITFVGYFAHGQIGEIKCISCSSNDIDFTKYASGIGTENQASGSRSFVGGMRSNAQGNYSIAFGYRAFAGGTNSISLGYDANANGMYSVAIGRQSFANGPAAFALGLDVNAQAESSYVFGEFLKATASGTVTIGHGAGGGENYLLNEIPNNIMMGVNSNLPTLFISNSDGFGTTGKIGIGNITDPDAKLHILGDDGTSNEENASLFIQSASNEYHSYLWLGDTKHGIKAMPNANLTFYTGSENDFTFENGNVGIGTPDPQHLLDVAGDIRFTGQLYDDNGLFEPSPWANDENGIFYDGGNVGIGIAPNDPEIILEVLGKVRITDFQLDNSDPGQGKILQSDEDGNASWVDPPPTDDGDWTIDDDENIFRIGGNVRIGNISTIDPDAKLDVGGKVKMTAFQLTDASLGANKILQSDANGNASWVEPPDTNDDDWVINNLNVYREEGNVGIGTNDPEAPLHINSNIGDTDAEFFKVENNGVDGSGETIIGKQLSGGPVLIQQAGDNDFSNQGSTLSFIQKSRNNDQGLNISTYTGLDHAVRWVSISAITSSLTVKAKTDLVLQSGGTDPISFATNGSPDGSPNGNPDSDGILRMQLNQYGQLGIGTTYHADNNFTLLTVAGGIHAKEVRVNMEAGGGADFVFDNDYDLPGIEEVDNFIQTNHHLPGIPPAEEMVNNGIDVGEMQVKLLQKIEELTLYVIELKKENEEMREGNAEMKVEIEKLKRR